MLSRAGRSLHEVQSHLDREGASDLVVELVIKSVHSPSIFEEAVELGIALLEGGNPIIQKSMYSKLLGGDLSQAFFKVRVDVVWMEPPPACLPSGDPIWQDTANERDYKYFQL